MSAIASPDILRFVTLGALANLHYFWQNLVNSIVPEPYLDEVFHIPQAQAYWAGNWTQWDPKITTPPGLYLSSHAIGTVQKWLFSQFDQSAESLRFSNFVLLYLLLVVLYIWTAVAKQPVDQKAVLQREFNIILFPLFFFFSGLYYTDIFSALTVMVTYTFWLASVQSTGVKAVVYQIMHLLAGLVSLSSRQTNIFWVAVFLGGLQLVDSVKKRSRQLQLPDPPIADAHVEDFATTSIAIVQSAFGILPRLVLDLWPQLALLVAFTAFIVWNGGVVLGDKDNHIATIHTPQMLYIWPCFVFFSWPVLLPQLNDLFYLSPSRIRSRLPRAITTTAFIALFITIVNTNTIIHPFTLADNRHYTFYVFRILRRTSSMKYAFTPIYLICAWLVIAALGGRAKSSQSADPVDVRTSFVLILLVSTTLSLITAPLVEPRYFIVPWLIWRLHVPLPNVKRSQRPAIATAKSKAGSSATNIQNISIVPASVLAITERIAAYSLWIELAWYMIINLATGYMFLYKGFTWPQEPGKVQRFMW